MKNFFLILTTMLTLSFAAQAQYYYPRPPLPPPYPGPYVPPVVPYYPVPVVPVPQPYVYTCYAQGTFNGLVFYGIGYDTYTANQRALIACQLSGQACILAGCR
ncbi:MAG: hypothetical protein JNL11_01880 [Bdellovibrionaceae bacterium]|nr:hypothetical protein [Pseudobdellovibrionaceae bacterium]